MKLNEANRIALERMIIGVRLFPQKTALKYQQSKIDYYKKQIEGVNNVIDRQYKRYLNN